MPVVNVKGMGLMRIAQQSQPQATAGIQSRVNKQNAFDDRVQGVLSGIGNQIADVAINDEGGLNNPAQLKAALDNKFQEVRNFTDMVTQGLTPTQKAAFLTMGVNGLGDITGLAADIEMYFTDPESRTWANAALSGVGAVGSVATISPSVAAILPMVKRNAQALSDTAQAALPKFTPSPETNAFKSRETATVMSPDDFLNLAEDLPENQVRLDSQEFIKDQISRGEPLETPFLTFSLDGKGVATVNGHEGRHRARVLKEMGVTEMPVRLRSEGTNQIRWSEQDNASNRDRLEVTWPSVLAPEKTNTNSYEIAFPIADPLKVELPPLSNAQRTQLGASTLPSYKKAAGVLGSEGRAIDFGAGRGQGAETIGFDTFEPYPREGFSPMYTTASDIPDQSYDRLTSLNVLNVMPRDVRDEAVSNIGRVLAPNGRAVVTTRGRDVLKAKGSLGDEPMSVITTADTYQKGFTQPELREYIQGQLGDEFSVRNLPEKIGQAGVLIERNGEALTPVQRQSAVSEMMGGDTVPAAMPEIRPARENLRDVIDSNFSMGSVGVDEMVSLDNLSTSMSPSVSDARRADELANKIQSGDGYIERIIVDNSGNVIEGQHRTEAMKRLGYSEIPATIINDLSGQADELVATGIRPEHARQIIDEVDSWVRNGESVSDYVVAPEFKEQYLLAEKLLVK